MWIVVDGEVYQSIRCSVGGNNFQSLQYMMEMNHMTNERWNYLSIDWINERKKNIYLWWVIGGLMFVLINEHNWHDWNTMLNLPYDPSTYPNDFDIHCQDDYCWSAVCRTICILRLERMNQRTMRYCIYLSIGSRLLNVFVVLLASQITWPFLHWSPTDFLQRTKNFQNLEILHDEL